jgi:hypothetical protein
VTRKNPKKGNRVKYNKSGFEELPRFNKGGSVNSTPQAKNKNVTGEEEEEEEPRQKEVTLESMLNRLDSFGNFVKDVKDQLSKAEDIEYIKVLVESQAEHVDKELNFLKQQIQAIMDDRQLLKEKVLHKFQQMKQDDPQYFLKEIVEEWMETMGGRDALREQVQRHNEEIKPLRDDHETLREDNDTLKQDNDTLKDRVNNLTDDNLELKSMVRLLSRNTLEIRLRSVFIVLQKQIVSEVTPNEQGLLLADLITRKNQNTLGRASEVKYDQLEQELGGSGTMGITLTKILENKDDRHDITHAGEDAKFPRIDYQEVQDLMSYVGVDPHVRTMVEVAHKHCSTIWK